MIANYPTRLAKSTLQVDGSSQTGHSASNQVGSNLPPPVLQTELELDLAPAKNPAEVSAFTRLGPSSNQTAFGQRRRSKFAGGALAGLLGGIVLLFVAFSVDSESGTRIDSTEVLSRPQTEHQEEFGSLDLEKVSLLAVNDGKPLASGNGSDVVALPEVLTGANRLPGTMLTGVATPTAGESSPGSGGTTPQNATTTSTATSSPSSPTVKSSTIETAATTRPTTTVEATTTTNPTATSVTPPPQSGSVVWQDDFNQLDTGTWTSEHSTYGDGNNELQCYRPENVSVTDGKLVLRALRETYTCPGGNTRKVTSGMIRSKGVAFSPGQSLEFRVKLTPADSRDQGGLWPAVWSSGWGGGGWPAGGELDYIEVMTAEDPNRVMSSLHYSGRDGNHQHQNRGEKLGQNFSADWHVIRFDYGRNGVLVWWLDGRESFRVSSAETLQGYPAPFNQTINELKINLALGGTPGSLAPGALGTGRSGATFEVDYIRILQN